MTMHDPDLEWHAWPLVKQGGQHVGCRAGVLVVHRPSGLGVVCESERSMMRNRERALARLTVLVEQWSGDLLADHFRRIDE